MTVGEFKAQFSEVLEKMKLGEKIAVTYGKKKEIVGYFTPKISKQTTKRKLGILEGKAKVVFNNDFELSENEFLGL